jgi:hypothetical protein
MNLVKSVFGSFDFSCINDAEFKEDSVREDIIAPLLKGLGYSAGGTNKIVRSRSLAHPYVMFGSTKKKLTYIPDYLLEVDDKPCFVLDAKAPNEDIEKGDNAAQVYSYAIHPEVRAWNYGLCNGRSLSLFEVNSIVPKQSYDLTQITEGMLLDINQKLNPRTIHHNEILDFALDGGTFLHIVMSMPSTMRMTFIAIPILSVGKINDELYSMNVQCNDMWDRPLAFAFDFDKPLFDILMGKITSTTSQAIRSSLSGQPYHYRVDETSDSITVTATLSDEPVLGGSGELFYPMCVVDFS